MAVAITRTDMSARELQAAAAKTADAKAARAELQRRWYRVIGVGLSLLLGLVLIGKGLNTFAALPTPGPVRWLDGLWGNLLFAVLIVVSSVGPLVAMPAAALSAPSGYVGLPDQNVQEDLPATANVSVAVPESVAMLRRWSFTETVSPPSRSSTFRIESSFPFVSERFTVVRLPGSVDSVSTVIAGCGSYTVIPTG